MDDNLDVDFDVFGSAPPPAKVSSRRASSVNSARTSVVADERDVVRTRLAAIMADRYQLPRSALASETDDERLNVPAVLGTTRRLLLGDMGTVEFLLEQSGSAHQRAHLEKYPIAAVLVCMGDAAAAAVSREFEKKRLAFEGLGACVDEEGYPILQNHLSAARTFIRTQLSAAAPAGGCVLVHCKEGKNRSACLCVAYLMLEERMPLTEAVEHVWQQRPIVLDNQSFVEQLMELADEEGLLS